MSPDVLISSGQLSAREGWRQAFDVNVTSTHLFTEAFADLLLASPEGRLLFIASGTSSLETASRGFPPHVTTHPAAGWPKPPAPSATVYRSSKAAMNMMMLEWARIVHNDNVKVFAVSPGFLATGLGGIGKENLQKMGALDPSVGANLVRDVVQGKRDADQGKVISANGTQPW